MNRGVPIIAVFTPNTLSSIGLRDILEQILPFATIEVCENIEALKRVVAGNIFHIFVSSELLVEHISLFDTQRHKVIALSNGGANAQALKGFAQINIQQSEQAIVESIKALQNRAHGTLTPTAMEGESCDALTPREIEVTKLLVEGLINKEIAERLNIGLTTVITHRKNIFSKLGVRSMGGLTIYAIMKRYIEI